MKRLSALLLAFCFLLASSRAQSPTSPTPPIQTGGEVAARAAIEVWLALVDDGQYERSWDEAAAAAKRVAPKDQWVKTFVDHRRQLGKVLSRTVKSTQSVTSLPGAPAGQYVVIRYNTSFEHKQAALETITCTVDESGPWKVTGYFVQ